MDSPKNCAGALVNKKDQDSRSGKRLKLQGIWTSAVCLCFGLLYGWDAWEAIGNLVGLQPFYEALGIGERVPWVLLWVGVIIPVVFYAVALVLALRRQRWGERIIFFVVGWASVAATSLSIASIEQALRALALQELSG